MEIKSKWLQYNFFSLLVLAMFNACEINEREYIWSVSAPMEYPVEVLDAWLFSDGYGLALHFGIANLGWGVGESKFHIPSMNKFEPDSLKMLWMSFSEEKFYKGTFQLPKEKIRLYFEQESLPVYNDSPRKGTYKNFLVGLAPEGKVVLWLADEASNSQIEIARFEAEEINITPEMIPEYYQYILEPDYISFAKANNIAYRPGVKKKIDSLGYSSPLNYTLPAKRYLWEPEIRCPEGARITHVLMSMYNGERELLLTEETISKVDRAIPLSFRVKWYDEYNNRCEDLILFSNDDYVESEIRKVFLEQIKEDIPLKIIININSREYKTDIFLEQEGKIYPINGLIRAV